jgi:hypothetical protein
VPQPPVVAVFDVNIYVDIAGLLPQPFSWADFDALAAQMMDASVPHGTNAAYDSLRAVAMSRTGQVGTGEALEVWTSEHIDKLTISQVQNVTDSAGVAWTKANAEDFHDQLVYGVVFDMTMGGTVGRILDPANHPPLDHEDGCVMRTAVASGVVIESPRYCITRDGPFRTAFHAGQLEPSVEVLYPSEWVEILRTARKPDLRRLLGGQT